MTDLSQPDEVRLGQLAQRFTDDMLEGFQTLAMHYGYRATYFIRMVGDYGGVGTAKRLLEGSKTSEGFAILWEKKQLGRSVEAWMLRPDFDELFDEKELAKARNRLEDHGFDVDAYLREVQG